MFQKLSDKSNSTADHSGGCSGRQKQRYRPGRSIRPELDLPAPPGPAVSPGELELPALARQLSLNTQARNPAAPVMTITGEDYAILDIESGKPRRLAGNRQYTDE